MRIKWGEVLTLLAFAGASLILLKLALDILAPIG